MGMYAHLHLDLELLPSAKNEVEAYISARGRLNSTSYYFYDQGYNKVEVDRGTPGHGAGSWDDPDHRLTILHTDISLKNYDNEIRDFLAFLSSRTVPNQSPFVGFVRHEEEEFPTLILWDGKEFTYHFTNANNEGAVKSWPTQET